MENNISICVDTADEAFEHWFNSLSKQNEKLDSRDGEVAGEILNAMTEIKDPTRCFMHNKIRKMSVRYAIGELLWYESYSNKLQGIQLYTNAWDRMSDNGETVNSNYGYCIHSKYGFDQYNYIKQLLLLDPNTRQAVIHIKTADNRPSKDVNCTVCLQFIIREEKLYMTTYMRSNDLWMGFPFDVFQFTCLQIRLAMELGLKLGSYTHIAGSLHLYQRNKITGLENMKKESN